MNISQERISGKWMIFTGRNEITRVWQAVSQALLNGLFPEYITSTKMHLFDERGDGDHHAKINVYTKDFSNETEVRDAEKAIIDCLTESDFRLQKITMMKYKSELYTLLNIFNNNKFNGVGIPPTLYTSIHVGRDRDRNRGFSFERYRDRGRGGRGRGDVRGRQYDRI